MAEWFDIKTRPDTGEFLAYDPVSGKQDVCFAAAILMPWLVEATQCDGEYGPDEDEFQGKRATHWRPLPDPPA